MIATWIVPCGGGIERVYKRYMSAYQSTITCWRSMNLEGNCKFPTNTADAYWRNATDSYSIRYTCESWHLKCVGNIDCSVWEGIERVDKRYMSAYQSTITSWRSLNLEGNCKFPTNTADAYWRNATDSYSIRYTCERWHLKCDGQHGLFSGGRYREGG